MTQLTTGISQYFFLFALYIATFSNIYAQKNYIDYNPEYRSWVNDMMVDKIEHKGNQTIMSVRVIIENSFFSDIYFFSPEAGDSTTWYLESKDHPHYKLKAIKNIRKNNQLVAKTLINDTLTMATVEQKGGMTHFTCDLYFDRLPEKLEKVDLIEGIGNRYGRNSFNIFDIILKKAKAKNLGDKAGMDERIDELIKKAVPSKPETPKEPEPIEIEPTPKRTRAHNAKPVPEKHLPTEKVIQDIYNNKHILWAAEVFVDYSPDVAKHRNGRAALLKAQAVGANDGLYYVYEDDHTLVNHLVVESMGRYDSDIPYPGYKDPELTEPMTYREFSMASSTTDTLITFDPETYEEIVQVVINELNPNDIKDFKLKLLVYYDGYESIFRSLPLAIAPMHGAGGEPLKPLYWKPVANTQKTDIRNKDHIWIKQVGYSIPIEGPNVNVLFGENDFFINDLVQDIHDGKVQPYDVYSMLGSYPLTQSEIQHIGTGIDTIITFDPVTFKEIVQVVSNELKAEDIKEIRVIEHWIWNEAQNQLYIRPMGYAPIIKRFDDKGNFLNSGPLFYIRERNAQSD